MKSFPSVVLASFLLVVAASAATTSTSKSAFVVLPRIQNVRQVSQELKLSSRGEEQPRPQPLRFPPFIGKAPPQLQDQDSTSSTQNDYTAALQQTSSASHHGTIPNLTVSLVKSIVGGAVLALPSGVAALGDNPDAVIPAACAIILVVGLMNAFFFSLIGKVCHWTGATGYRQAWERTVGTDTSQAVATVLALKTTLSCLAYAIILGDSFAALANAAHVLPFAVTRVQALECVAATVLLPLCLKKDLSSLAPFSLLGLSGILFTATSIAVRHWDGSYSSSTDVLNSAAAAAATTATSYAADMPLQPVFGTVGPQWQGVVLACTLATAFVAHYNAPRFHSELQDNTIERFNSVTAAAFMISIVVFAIVASQGFATFGTSAQPFILNNYSPYDPMIGICRAAVAVSLCMTFPLPFVGLRDNCLDAVQVPKEERTPELLSMVTVGLISAIVVLASNVTDLGFVLSVGGGTFSTTVSSVFPTLMFRAAVQQNLEKAQEQQQQQQPNTAGAITTTTTTTAAAIDYGDPIVNQVEANIALALMAVCVAIGGTGVTIAIDKVYHFL